MRRRRHQLELFGPEADPKVPLRPVDLQVTHPGLYLSPISAFTNGPLNAIESARVVRGLSIARAGAMSREFQEVHTLCVDCLKKVQGNRKRFSGIALYKPVSKFGPVEGELFTCSLCRVDFEAHSDECWSK